MATSKYLLLAAGLCTLNACTTQKPLPIRASSAPDAAKVRFVQAPKSVRMHLYPEHECNNGIDIHRDLAKEPPLRVGMLDSPDDTKTNVAEISVAAGQRINMGFQSDVPRCYFDLSFVAAAGKQYEVALEWKPTSVCGAKVSTLELVGGNVLRKPVTNLGRMVCKQVPP